MNALAEINQGNADQTGRLRELIGKLSDQDLRAPMPAGWTVASVLAHLAFWDQRAITLIEKWKSEGISPSPVDSDVVNEVARKLCLAIEPRRAAKLAVETAEEVDKVIAGLTPEMAAAILAKGLNVKLNRADHRRAHMGEIEKVLQNQRK